MPLGLIIEQVEGFARGVLGESSPLELLLSKLFAIVGKDGKQWFVAAKVFPSRLFACSNLAHTHRRTHNTLTHPTLWRCPSPLGTCKVRCAGARVQPPGFRSVRSGAS